MATVANVSPIVLRRCTDLGITQPNSVMDYVDEVRLAILNYCNISEVPDELTYTWVGMTIDYLRWMQSTKKSTSGDVEPGTSSTPTVVSSIREGDTTLGFSVDTSSPDVKALNAHSMDKVLDSIVLNYQDALNRFRRVVW